MTAELIRTELDIVRAMLERLLDHPSPQRVRSVTHQALQELENLSHHLPETERQSRLAALYRVGQSLGTSLNLDEVLNQVMDAVIELTGAERGFLMLLDNDTGELNLRAARNIEQETLQRKDMEVSRTVIQSTLMSGNGVITTNALTDPRFSAQESVITYALRSILCAPLRARGKKIGVVFVDNRIHTGVFSQEDLDLLNAFASQAAVAIENAQLYTRTDQDLANRVQELETLNQIDRQLSASLDLEHVMQVIQTWAVDGTQAERAWIALIGEQGADLADLTGEHGGRSFSLDHHKIVQALSTGESVSFPPHDTEPAVGVAPLLQLGKPIGVLAAEGKETFSTTTIEFLARLAARSAIAIQNARLYQAVQQANLAKSKFVSVVSHEMRIPMTSIKGYADILLKEMAGPVTDQQSEYLSVIRNSVERMAKLVGDLSDISRIETGQLKLEPSMIALRDPIQITVNGLRPKLDEKGQNLEIHIPEALPDVYADPNRVTQVLTNLVSNAWKYTPEGGWITLAAREEGGQVLLEVRDTGIGISTAEQEKLFTQFFRADDPAVRDQPGWGLGLNVTRRLVELMGGEIGFSSQLGKGSQFWFTLPTQA